MRSAHRGMASAEIIGLLVNQLTDSLWNASRRREAGRAVRRLHTLRGGCPRATDHVSTRARIGIKAGSASVSEWP